MDKSRISFEVAKLAKEKGFRQNELWFYRENGDTYYTNGNAYGSQHSHLWFAAHYQSELMGWLRDTHNLHICTFPTTAAEGVFHRVYISKPVFPVPSGYNSVPWNPDQSKSPELRHSSYEDTINMALIAALNLI